ncbi:MAG: ABC transporter permease [Gammaproteobacteria bacterium]|nr:ABC transporter permease [Gammaproteobacteria bacterium]
MGRPESEDFDIKNISSSVNGSLASAEALTNPVASRSFWADARLRFFKNKMAVLSVIVLLALVLFAIFAGFLAQYSNEEIDWSLLGRIKQQGAPSLENGHYFGVDELGRDMFARVVQGSQVSLLVAFTAAIGSIVLGTLAGAVSGYYSGRVDAVLMSFNEITLAIPYIIFFVVWQAFFGRSMLQMLLVMTLINWNSGYLIVRGQVLMLKNREFVDAAKLMGASDKRIIILHLLPNMLGIIVISASLAIPQMIMYESLVSFLGVGIQEPSTSWGALISEGARTMQFGTLWQLYFPALFFVLAQVSLYYIGDGMRDALDPKDR